MATACINIWGGLNKKGGQYTWGTMGQREHTGGHTDGAARAPQQIEDTCCLQELYLLGVHIIWSVKMEAPGSADMKVQWLQQGGHHDFGWEAKLLEPPTSGKRTISISAGKGSVTRSSISDSTKLQACGFRVVLGINSVIIGAVRKRPLSIHAKQYWIVCGMNSMQNLVLLQQEFGETSNGAFWMNSSNSVNG